MTEEYYKEQRAYWVEQAMSINRRFFPKCFRARVKEIARLDAEHDGRERSEVMKELLKQWEEDV